MTLIEELGQWRTRSLEGARAAMGIAGDRPPPLRRAVGSWYPIAALTALVLVADLQTLLATALGPEITASLGISKAELTAALVFKTVVIAAAGVPAAAIAQRRGGRGRICLAAGAVWTLAALMTLTATTLFGLLILLSISGLAVGAFRAVQPSLLIDSYRPAVRMRMLSAAQAAASLGIGLAAVVVAVGMHNANLTWRGTFLVVAAVSLAAVVVAGRLRDPGFGSLDIAAVATAARAAGALAPIDDQPPADDSAAGLGVVETCRRILMIPAFRWLLVADSLIGVLLVPFSTYLAFFLRSRWDIGPGGRATVAGVYGAVAAVGVLVAAGRAERTWRHDPARLVRTAAVLILVAVVLMIAGLTVTSSAPSLVLLAAMQVPVAAVLPIVTIAVLTLVPPRMRAQAAALHAAVLFGVGGVSGIMLLGSVDRRFGTAAALGVLALPSIAGALVLHGASRLIDTDLDRLLEQVVESEELREVHATGQHVPMLACRHVDFSYGSVQVLFDVGFTVDEGEMVALLGTNGAGKSTLLRVISGLGFPTRGSVRLDGADVTYIDAERRLALGISQIPGGRAIFPPLTVVENLRVSGFSFGRHKAAVDRGIDATFAAFPRLAERRNQLASTLSGGEQQMLGLGKAFILQPRLLLIDELSLGLAPKIVGDLLDMVRGINQTGTAVVLVEQSVNVALSLVDHAYFMEKGEVRFDGQAADLLDRPDLLRSVFLEGAGATTSTTNGRTNSSRRRKARNS